MRIGAWLATPALALVVLVAGCGATLQTEVGIVVAVDSNGPASVAGFTLRTADGRTIGFSTRDTVFDRSGFPPEHLREHLALASPVRVTYQIADGTNAVVKLEDAPPS
jgi:hypothetical protein